MISLTKLKRNRFTLFCLVGAVSSTIDIVLLYIGVSLLGLPVLLAASLSFAVSSINGYLLNQRFTFGEGAASTRKYAQYLTVSIVGLGLTILFMHVFMTLGIHYLIAKVVTILLVLFWNYFANVLWTFRQKPE